MTEEKSNNNNNDLNEDVVKIGNHYLKKSFVRGAVFFIVTLTIISFIQYFFVFNDREPLQEEDLLDRQSLDFSTKTYKCFGTTSDNDEQIVILKCSSNNGSKVNFEISTQNN